MRITMRKESETKQRHFLKSLNTENHFIKVFSRLGSKLKSILKSQSLAFTKMEEVEEECPTVYEEEPKVPELEETIESLREQLKHYKKLYKSQQKMVNYLRPFQKKAQVQEEIVDESLAKQKAMNEKIKELQAENEQLKARLSA